MGLNNVPISPDAQQKTWLKKNASVASQTCFGFSDQRADIDFQLPFGNMVMYPTDLDFEED